MDFRRADNPFPFTRERLKSDWSRLQDGEARELDYLLIQAARAVTRSQRLLEHNPRRGEMASRLEIAAGYLDRALSALLTAHQHEHPEPKQGRTPE